MGNPQDNHWKIKRRTMLSTAASFFVLNQVSISEAKEVFSTASTRKVRAKSNSVPSVTFKEFLELSRFLTASKELDMKAGERIFAWASEDPRFLGEVKILFEHYKNASQSQRENPMDFFMCHNVSKDLIRKLVTAWYTGIGETNKDPKFFCYFDALMYRPVLGVRNVPASCGGALNFWAQPPESSVAL